MSDESLIAIFNKGVPEMSSTGSTVDNSCVVKKGGPSLPAVIYSGICLALFSWMYFSAYQYMLINMEGWKITITAI
jgi:hypothetical protein